MDRSDEAALLWGSGGRIEREDGGERGEGLDVDLVEVERGMEVCGEAEGGVVGGGEESNSGENFGR